MTKRSFVTKFSSNLVVIKIAAQNIKKVETKEGKDGPRSGGGGGGVLPYMGYIGMCRCEGYGFQAVYSRIGYINQSVWV